MFALEGKTEVPFKRDHFRSWTRRRLSLSETRLIIGLNESCKLSVNCADNDNGTSALYQLDCQSRSASLPFGPSRAMALYCGRRRRQEGVETLLDDGVALA
jgi:hypothetical protein